MVDFPSELQKIRNEDRPSVSHTSTPTASQVADDLALLFNEEVGASSRALNRRQLILPVAAVQLLNQLYDQWGHPAKKTLAMATLQFKQQLRMLVGVEKLLGLCEGDPALTFIVLKNVEAQSGTEATLARDAIIKLEARFRGEIQAGLNTAAALRAGCADLQERQALRMLYYTNVVSRQSLVKILQALLDVYGDERFSKGLKVMQKALADDIAAKVSSLPSAHLRTLLLGLQSCWQLGGVFALCQALIERLRIERVTSKLMQRLLGYTTTGIDSQEFQRLLEELDAGSQLSRTLIALNAIYSVFNKFPLALWFDNRTREELLHNLLVRAGELTKMEREYLQATATPETLA